MRAAVIVVLVAACDLYSARSPADAYIPYDFVIIYDSKGGCPEPDPSGQQCSPEQPATCTYLYEAGRETCSCVDGRWACTWCQGPSCPP